MPDGFDGKCAEGTIDEQEEAKEEGQGPQEGPEERDGQEGGCRAEVYGLERPGLLGKEKH